MLKYKDYLESKYVSYSNDVASIDSNLDADLGKSVTSYNGVQSAGINSNNNLLLFDFN